MKHKYYIFLILLLTPFFTPEAIGQNVGSKMSEASQVFSSGDYEKAKSLYLDIYLDSGNNNANKMIDVCNNCIKLLSSGLRYERDDNFSKAIECYQSILIVNPNDNKVNEMVLSCKQKQYRPLIDGARQLYKEGRYDEAKLKLQEYSRVSGQTDESLLAAIMECQLWASEANNAMSSKNYDTARNYYEKLIAINPTDAISAKALADVNSLTRSTKTVFVHTSTKKSLRPIKNKFDFFVYSGFSNPIAFGGGIGFNISYFHLSLDGGGSMGQEGLNIYESYNKIDLNNFAQVDDNTYAQGNMQITLTPGINLKYFSVGIGLGTMMTKQYYFKENNRGYFDVEGSCKKSRFLFRPTINGFIPFDSEFSAGLMVMAGYNVVSGVSGLNQFILGLGMFF